MKLFALLAALSASGVSLTQTPETIQVRNGHYVAVITRSPAGLLTSLTSPDGRTTFLTGHTIYTDVGIYGPGRGHVGTREEEAPRVEVQRADGKITITSTGHLRGKLAEGKKLIPYRVAYTFDATPQITVECEVTPPYSQPEVKGFLATYFHVPKMNEWAVNTIDGVIREDCRKQRGRNYSAKVTPLNADDPRVGLLNADGRALLVSDVQWTTPIAPQNVIIHGTAFFFAWLDGLATELVQKPYRVWFVLTVGKLGALPLR